MIRRLESISNKNITYISLGSKGKLMRSLVISILLYTGESWTLTVELEKKECRLLR